MSLAAALVDLVGQRRDARLNPLATRSPLGVVQLAQGGQPVVHLAQFAGDGLLHRLATWAGSARSARDNRREPGV